MTDLIQQALEALELSAPLPGHEERWSDAINALYAAKDAQALAMPAGFVLVPTEPDEARQQAGYDAMFADSDLKRRDGLRIVRNGYRAMVAPQEPRK